MCWADTDRLIASFEVQGHTVFDRSHGDVELVLMCGEVPDTSEPLRERIPEGYPPLSAMLRQRHGLRRNPRHVAVVVEVPGLLSDLPHAEVVATARTAMGRLGAAKVLFVSRGEIPGQAREVTFRTMEGGHPTEVDDMADRMRDRLVTAVCAQQVAEDYDTVRDAITAEVWQASTTPEQLADAGRRMGQLGLSGDAGLRGAGGDSAPATHRAGLAAGRRCSRRLSRCRGRGG